MLALVKKGVQFEWTLQQENAFRLLQKKMMEAPILKIPNESKQFILETDSSGYASGAVLLQEHQSNTG